MLDGTYSGYYKVLLLHPNDLECAGHNPEEFTQEEMERIGEDMGEMITEEFWFALDEAVKQCQERREQIKG